MSEPTSPSNTCPKCGVALPSTATAGLCPRCLMAEAMVSTQVDTGPSAQPPLPPEQIAPHFPQLEILECLGRGGMGVVYKTRQKTLNRFVALKLLAPERVRDTQFAERFTREAQALAALSHPNIITIHDFGQAGGFYYLVMEFVDGANLRQLLRARKFTPEEALAIVPPLCDALQYAHDRGIVHRDIKPENLLLDKAGRVKVADFGIAKMLGTASDSGNAGPSPTPENATQTALGTPSYSAPEQKTDPRRVDNRADIYSLGVVFYEMLTGELPGKPIEPPSSRMGGVQIDVRLDQVVLRALEKKPELRYQQASEVKTMVETITQSSAPLLSSPPVIGSSTSTPVQGASKTRKSTTARTIAFITACVLLVAVAGIAAVLFYTGHETIQIRGIPRDWSCLNGDVSQWNWMDNALYGHTTNGDSILASTRKFGDVTISAMVSTTNREASLALRMQDPDDGYLVIFGPDGTPTASWNGGHIWLIKRKSGQEQQLAVFNRRGLSAPGQLEKLTVIAKGPRFEVRLNDVTILKTADSTFASGYIGLRVYGDPKYSCDGVFSNVTVRARRWEKASAEIGAFQVPKLNPVDDPRSLQKLPTEQVIQIGLTELQTPWAWVELQNRATRGMLSTNQVESLMTDLTAWMSRHYPHGYESPLNSLGTLLAHLDRLHLISETNALAFVKAYCGQPALEPMSRLREGDRVTQTICDLRSPWHDSLLLGFDMLNHVQAIQVDGRSIQFKDTFGADWNQQQYVANLKLPPLTPGRHTVQCDVDTACVAISDLAGLDINAPPEDWPPAKLRWMRSCQTTLMVYPKDAVIVALSEDPALNPVLNGAISIKEMIVRRAGGGLNVVPVFDFSGGIVPPYGVDVTLRIAGQSIQCGNLTGWASTNETGTVSMMPRSAMVIAELASLDSNIRKADIVLTPDPKILEGAPVGVDRIWGKEIVIPNIPIKRDDLESQGSAVAFQSSPPSLRFGAASQGDDPPPSGLVELKEKWQPGKRYMFDLDFKQHTAFLLYGRSNTVDEAVTMGNQVGVTAVQETPGGGHELEREFLSFQMGIKLGDHTILDYNSAKESAADQTNGAAAVLREIVGSRLRVFLDANNDPERLEGVGELVQRIQSVPQADPLATDIKKIFNAAFFEASTNVSILPHHAVRPGDTWTSHHEYTAAGTGIEVWDYTHVFQTWEMHDNHRCARLESQGIMNVKPDPSSKRDETTYRPRNGIAEGVIWFDPELGQIVEIDMKNDVNEDKRPRDQQGQLVTTQRHQVYTVKLER